MFLSSQLVEISQRFQSDVEDLQVLLQEEGLPIRSAGSLGELSARLDSDPNFRRDVAFLVRSMLGREGDQPGTMDVLGVLIIAGAGTRQGFDDPVQQQLIRELLRFVIQQRRSAAVPSVTTDPAERPAAVPTASSPPPAVRQQRPSPAHALDVVALPSLMRAEPEKFSRRAPVGWIAAAVAVLLLVVAGLLIRRGASYATSQTGAWPTTRSAASATYPAASEGEHRALVPPSTDSSLSSQKHSPRLGRRGARHAEPPQTSVPPVVAASTPSKAVERTGPAQIAPSLSQSVSATVASPARAPQEAATVPSAGDMPRKRGIPDSTKVSSVFAHAEAVADAGASQVAPPVFRPKDPVLIARNDPAAASVKPELQGTVHTGSTGTMASSLMYSPEPEYPARAIAAGVQGQVTVRATVGPGGNVIDASIVSGPPLLREAALDAVERWRYRPYEQDGKPVTIATTAILDFQLPPRK